MVRSLYVFFLICPLMMKSQSNDCATAIAVDRTLEFKASSIMGPGRTIEMTGNPTNDPFYLTEEHNTIWYSFIAPYNATFTFRIIPANPGDDWDFMLFEANDPQSCQLIAGKKITPVRSNRSPVDEEKKGVTGLNLTASEEHVKYSDLSNFSKSLKVTKGQKFLLLVDGRQPGRNHQLKINFDGKPADTAATDSSATQASPIRKMVDWVNEKNETPKTKYTFLFFESPTNQPVSCESKVIIEQKGFGEDSIAIFQGQSEIKIEVEASTNFSLNVNKLGYMFHSSNFRSFRVDTSIVDTFYIPKAKAGEMISLEDISFKENTTHLLTSSINALQQIYQFLIENPNAVIEIRGHVNAPGYDNAGRVKTFSEKRAEEVKNFLIGMGIDKKRLKTVGMGNEFMIYPSPSTYEQEKANRRVEILILEN